ncbi:nitroreductase A [Lottiidibacillus patelloidae]|uniref:Nitroreductase A n=1 Tax=Lottiidibacillus patelloidae TaxID=2670334 RepID=A0A263BWH8_9BACI|nr:oxygen-insensitive NADPH nitroreductase [Lottiidibacillus patelloidae]OZM57677.1 nitroreductase A [Lottiidibacillus patelloidae]
MNDVIQTLLQHRSIRKFENRLLDKEQIEAIVTSAQAASTSSNVQAYAIIGITDQYKKERLAQLSGDQPYVAKNGHLFIFCADLYRHKVIAETEQVDFSETLQSTEMYTVAVIDAALAAQNAAIAAESLGLGICYIGGLRNELYEVSKLLQTPEHVFPLFGLVVGYPAHTPEQKPRLPMSAMYYEEQYVHDTQKVRTSIEQYNDELRNYYDSRAKNSRLDTWSKQIIRKMSVPSRIYLKDFLKSKGFPMK